MTRPALRFYVHVPYCSARCGYCDFNTYVPGESGRGAPGLWRGAAEAETRLARTELADDPRPVSSIFFGGGTPTLLPADDLGAVISMIRSEFGLTPAAEITVEANPENISEKLLGELLSVGVNRLSIGMQSADPVVLSHLDRRHGGDAAVRATDLAITAGFGRLSLDLIYATPGETDDSWRGTVQTAIDSGVGHVSAYALKVEPGTALARQVSTGVMPPVDDDAAASRYEIADDMLSHAGLQWYEISNWARAGQECHHNLGYWRGDDWWGVGPGAHSHVAGTRWWNRRHPQAWIDSLRDGSGPRAGQEVLTGPQRTTEAVMLAIRLAEGFDPEALAGPATPTVDLIDRGLLERCGERRCRLTRRGRLLADALTLELLAAAESSGEAGDDDVPPTKVG